MRSQDEEARVHASTGDTTRGALRSIARRDPPDPSGARAPHAPDDRPAAWDALIARSHARLRVLAHFLLGRSPRRTSDVDDVLQETWSEALARLEDFEYRGRGSFQRWIAGILRKKVLEAGRACGRDLRTRIDAGRASTPLAAALERAQLSASADARQRELEERVRGALERLPADERAALLMLLYEGLTVREAGARAHVDPATISLRAKRGLSRCARTLRGFAP
jgi:RNA polymerase sigma-70 factor (ECF subfamily)